MCILDGHCAVSAMQVTQLDPQVWTDGGQAMKEALPILSSHVMNRVLQARSEMSQLGVWEARYFQSISRSSVILVGDSLRDPDSLERVPGMEHALRVGFYNAHDVVKSRQKQKYASTFDMLLSTENLDPRSDLDMGPVIGLLQELLEPTDTDTICEQNGLWGHQNSKPSPSDLRSA
eukprot:3937098-Amphidinium_carterae.1